MKYSGVFEKRAAASDYVIPLLAGGAGLTLGVGSAMRSVNQDIDSMDRKREVMKEILSPKGLASYERGWRGSESLPITDRATKDMIEKLNENSRTVANVSNRFTSRAALGGIGAGLGGALIIHLLNELKKKRKK